MVPPVAAETEEDADGRLAALAADLAGRLDLAGSLARALLFARVSRPPTLVLTVHHLVVDALSWRPLLEDLATLYEALELGQTPALPPNSASYLAWARDLACDASVVSLK